MKHYSTFLMGAILVACSPASPQKIQQDITEDKMLSDTISKYKNKKEYNDLLEAKNYLNSIEQKQNLTESDNQKLESMDITGIINIKGYPNNKYSLDYNMPAIQELCIQCCNIECDTYKNGQIIRHSDSPCCNTNKDSIISKVTTLVNSFMDDFPTYCEQYNEGTETFIKQSHNDIRRYTKEDAVQECKYGLKTYFCTYMFNVSDFDINFKQIASQQRQYATTAWEKSTGCKNAKSTHNLSFFYTVLQQTNDGTLAVVDHNYRPYGTAPEIVFITKNKTDSKLTDGERIPGGIHEEIGIYKYTNTLGSVSTVKKYRRCESK